MQQTASDEHIFCVTPRMKDTQVDLMFCHNVNYTCKPNGKKTLIINTFSKPEEKKILKKKKRKYFTLPLRNLAEMDELNFSICMCY